MKHEFWFDYLASGCMTRCMHCARLGRGMSQMSIGDIESLFTEIRRLQHSDPETKMIDVAMFEVMNHQDPLAIFTKRAEILGLQKDHMYGISSSGHAIGKREDWRRQLEGLKELGTEKFWLSIHGGEKVHDYYVGMRGAYSLVREAVRRIHEFGFTCGTSVYLNANSLAAFSELVDVVQSTGFDEYYFGIASYFPYARHRRYDKSRPTLEQIAPHAKIIKSMDKHSPEKWDNLTDFTESAWVEQALEATGEDAEIRWTKWNDDNVLQLVALRDLDVHDGDLSFPGNRYGNVKSDGLAKVFNRAEAAKAEGTYKSPTDVRNFFGEVEPPQIAELAAQVGNRTSMRIDDSPRSMRLQWLDRLYSDRRLL